MKAIIVLVVLVLIAGLLGWLTLSNSNDTATIGIDKQEVQKDTEAAVETVKKAVNDIEDKFDEPETAAPPLQSPTPEETVPP